MTANPSPGAALRALRPTRTYTCAVCGESFTASDERATYCSNRCRQRAKTARAKQKRLDTVT